MAQPDSQGLTGFSFSRRGGQERKKERERKEKKRKKIDLRSKMAIPAKK